MWDRDNLFQRIKKRRSTIAGFGVQASFVPGPDQCLVANAPVILNGFVAHFLSFRPLFVGHAGSSFSFHPSSENCARLGHTRNGTSKFSLRLTLVRYGLPRWHPLKAVAESPAVEQPAPSLALEILPRPPLHQRSGSWRIPLQNEDLPV